MKLQETKKKDPHEWFGYPLVHCPAYPGVVGEQFAGLRMELDLLRGPEAEAHYEGALHLPDINLVNHDINYPESP